jgi:pilus assembly protein CpaE
MPQRVALLDLDLVFDDAALELNLSLQSSLASIAEADLSRLDPAALSAHVVEHASSLRVLVGATRPEDGERVTAAHVRAALAVMKRQFLVTVVDCGTSFSEPTLAALETGDRVLVVCTPELSTLRDVRDCQRLFGQALRVEPTRVSYVFNHPLPSVGLTRQQFESALEKPMWLEIPHAGESATKPVFAKAISQLAGELRPPDSGSGDEPLMARPAGTARAQSGINRLLRLGRGHS